MLTFEPFEGTLDDWGQIVDRFPERQIFQTPAWIRFVAATQQATPVIAVLKDGREAVGYFSGLIVRKFGLPILGSPFQGWTTSYMGILLPEGVSRHEALQALIRFAFHDLGCVHLEMTDRCLRHEDADDLPFEHADFSGFEIDLTQTEDQLFGNMTSACRRCIRKAERVGVVIEEVHDAAFADDYYAQLEDVFAKQSLVPTYSKARVRALIEHLLPTGNLLLLRARDPEGHCIATGIFPAMNTHMYFWGGASWRPYQILRPNEAVQWYAIRYWKARGMRTYEMGGGGGYKLKYGVHCVKIPILRISKYPLLGRLRHAARRLVKVRQRLLGRWRAWTESPQAHMPQAATALNLKDGPA